MKLVKMPMLFLIAAISFSPLTHADKKSDLIAQGKQQFKKECAMCHEGFNTAVIMLGKRLGKEKSVISQRDDLTEAYVKYVVRNGLLGMPAITRVEVTNEQLDAIAAYLARKQ